MTQMSIDNRTEEWRNSGTFLVEQRNHAYMTPHGRLSQTMINEKLDKKKFTLYDSSYVKFKNNHIYSTVF